MRKIVSILLIAGLIAPTGLMAQKVYKNASNKVILDMTVIAGMPTGTVTNTSKTAVYNLYTAANNTSWLINATDNLPSGYLNATVYERLEIAPSDESDATWATAFNSCKNKSGGGWRLPTQRELMMMWIFSDAIVSLSGSMFIADSYWSSNDDTTTNAWYVNFERGATGNYNKTISSRVRCVREL